ncbi:MAG: hypothetical protein WC666_02970 [Candidatus Paceibacterota bacterium]|jgi:hypothetical protein
MNTKFISDRALSVIDQYLNFKVGNATCSVPYFNNKTTRARLALRTYIGKGSPKEIFEEVQDLLLKNRIDLNAITNESLKKLLVDNNIGIECSGFAYYVLNAESEERSKGALDKHLSFINCHGLFGKIVCSLRPTENCDVSTLAHNKNSFPISIKDTQVGDIITMIGNSNNENGSTNDSTKPLQESSQSSRNHILIIHRIEYQNFVPCVIHYSHAVSYPMDGIYGNGIRQGRIDIVFPDKPITEALWSEDNKTGENNPLFVRAQKTKVEIRRLRWF